MPRADDIRWFKQQFRGQIERELTGTPFDLDMIIAIACQETGYIWSVLRKKQLPLDRVVALAADPRRQRWNQRSVTSGQLAAEYGFTDIDGSRPDVWRYNQAIEAGDHDANPSDYR